jgi:hypothetical protein
MKAYKVFAVVFLAFAGCNAILSDNYRLAVSNRHRNPIEVSVNGRIEATIGAGESRQIEVSIRSFDRPTGYANYAPTEFAQATVDARDVTNNRRSPQKLVYVYTDRVTPVEFSSWDFLYP